MQESFTGLVDILHQALPSLDGEFDVYELTAGVLANESMPNVTLVYPAYYLTNITSPYHLDMSELMTNLSMVYYTANELFLLKEPFVGGVIALSFVLSGIVTAGWMFFLLLLLSSNSIPNSLILTNLFFCAGHSAMLTKLTQILQSQVDENLADTTNILYLVTYADDIIVVRCITTLLVWISWIDLVIQINKYSRRRLILGWGLVLSLTSFAFAVAYSFLYRTGDGNPHFPAVKVIHYILEYFMVTMFGIQVLLYSFRKRRFAYHRRAMALAIFALCTLLTPYAFITIDICSNALRSWSTYVQCFTKLCITVVTWEWLHTIRSLQLKYEKKAVLGRRISNDNFAQITGIDPGEPQQANAYILKSVNIVGLLSYFHPIRWCKARTSGGDKARTVADVERISLQSMGEHLSPRVSNMSQDTGLSIVADNPRFDVDHRYLRNTPSTLHSRNTPISYTNATPDIPEDARYTHTPRNGATADCAPNPNDHDE